MIKSFLYYYFFCYVKILFKKEETDKNTFLKLTKKTNERNRNRLRQRRWRGVTLKRPSNVYFYSMNNMINWAEDDPGGGGLPQPEELDTVSSPPPN